MRCIADEYHRMLMFLFNSTIELNRAEVILLVSKQIQWRVRFPSIFLMCMCVHALCSCFFAAASKEHTRSESPAPALPPPPPAPAAAVGSFAGPTFSELMRRYYSSLRETNVFRRDVFIILKLLLEHPKHRRISTSRCVAPV